LVNEGGLSIAKSCAVVGLSRRAWYRPDPAEKQFERDQPVVDALNRLLDQYPRWGFWKYFHTLRGKKMNWNHKRVYRVYCAMKLNQKRRVKRILPSRPKTPLEVPSMPNHTWSFDFMSDTLYGGHRYRILNVIDEGTREALEITIATSISSARLVRALDNLVAEYGKPRRIRVDNGAEMTSNNFVSWCRENGIEIIYIQPGKPNQNAYIERFNRSFRTEILDAHLFHTLAQVREIAWAWRITYNEERPHQSLGNITPAEFKRLATAEIPINQLCA
jgi:putative transposase